MGFHCSKKKYFKNLPQCFKFLHTCVDLWWKTVTQTQPVRFNMSHRIKIPISKGYFGVGKIYEGKE